MLDADKIFNILIWKLSKLNVSVRFALWKGKMAYLEVIQIIHGNLNKTLAGIYHTVNNSVILWVYTKKAWSSLLVFVFDVYFYPCFKM